MSNDNLDFGNLVRGKTIVVTGCSSGIGAQTARVLRANGATVVGMDRNPSDAVDNFIQVDLSDPTAIDAAIAAAPAGLDGLCNIAGLPPTLAAHAVLKVNFLGLRQLTLGLIGKMADGASIVNLASLAGIGWPQAVSQVEELIGLRGIDDADAFCVKHDIEGQQGRSYFLSKEALIVWTMQNRWTWRDRGIRMNCVSPGPVATPILKDFLETLGERAEEDARIMDRPGEPTDIAPVVTFLLSDAAAWMRGLNVPTDGGMSSHVTLAMNGLAA